MYAIFRQIFFSNAFTMMNFQGSNILSVSQLDREAIARILDISARMAPYAARQKRCTVLEGAILSNLFFEPG